MPTIRKPKRISGLAKPDPYDRIAQGRAEAATEIVESLWVDTDVQRGILQEIRSYMRVCKTKRRGTPLGGRRLSQYTQAGKSAIVERLIHELAQEDIAAGKIPNPFRVVHITVGARMTLKMLFLDILNRLADDFLEEPNFKGSISGSTTADDIRGKPRDNVMVLEQRIQEWVAKLGVELIVIDEVQLLATKPERNDDPFKQSHLTADAFEVTKKFQSFIDHGVVPLLFIGDETSEAFFKLNGQFAARLKLPLELPPLDVTKASHRKKFMDFCLEYDRQIVLQGAAPIASCLNQPKILHALIAASGGHVGRASRIIQIALPAALKRGATTMEAYDLSNAVRDFVFDLGWVDIDPFSVVPDPVPPAAAPATAPPAI